MIPKIGVIGFRVALDGFSRYGMVPMGPFVSLYGTVPVGAPVNGLPVSLCGIVPLEPVGGLLVEPSLWGTVPQKPEPEPVGGLPVPVYGGRVSGVGPVGGGPVVEPSL